MKEMFARENNRMSGQNVQSPEIFLRLVIPHNNSGVAHYHININK